MSERSIRACTTASLELAAKQGARSIAFPVLGSGIGGFDFELAAAILRDAIADSADAAALDEIVFYGFLPEQAAALERIMG